MELFMKDPFLNMSSHLVMYLLWKLVVFKDKVGLYLDGFCFGVPIIHFVGPFGSFSRFTGVTIMLSLSRFLRVNIDKGNKGLTLIELLIVIALIAIIAAIALPIILNILFTTKTAATTTSTKSVAGFPGQWTQVGQTVTYVPPNDPTLGQKYGGGLIAFTDTNGNGVYDSGEPIIAHIQGGNASMNATPNWNAPPPPVITQPNATCDRTALTIDIAHQACIVFIGIGTSGVLCFYVQGYIGDTTFWNNSDINVLITSNTGSAWTGDLAPNAGQPYPYFGTCSGYPSSNAMFGFGWPSGQTVANYTFTYQGKPLYDLWNVTVPSGSSSGSGSGSGSTTTQTTIAFQTDFEGGAPTTWTDSVSSNGGASNVSSPQMHVVSTSQAHSGQMLSCTQVQVPPPGPVMPIWGFMI